MRPLPNRDSPRCTRVEGEGSSSGSSHWRQPPISGCSGTTSSWDRSARRRHIGRRTSPRGHTSPMASAGRARPTPAPPRARPIAGALIVKPHPVPSPAGFLPVGGDSKSVQSVQFAICTSLASGCSPIREGAGYVVAKQGPEEQLDGSLQASSLRAIYASFGENVEIQHMVARSFDHPHLQDHLAAGGVSPRRLRSIHDPL